MKEVSGNDIEYYMDGVIVDELGDVKSYAIPEGYVEPNLPLEKVDYYFTITDWLGTTRSVIDENGVQLNAVDHFPFGLRMPDRNSYTTGQEGQRYQFTGHEYDGETGYDYHGARYYNRELGRYMSVDPLAKEFFGWSSYNYTMGNPINLIDPDGKEPNPPKNVHYYNMKKQSDGSYKSVISYSSSSLVLKGDAIFKSKSGETSYMRGNNTTYLEQEASSVNVYTYWNSDGSMNRQVVKSNTDKISNYLNHERPGLVSAPLADGSSGVIIAAAGVGTSKLEKLTSLVSESRSGYTSGTVRLGSKVYTYNKAKAANIGTTVKYLGFGLSALSAIKTETDYDSGSMSSARRQYNHVNTAIGVVFPSTGLAIGIGDYVGQAYEPQITYSVTKGSLNQFVTGCLEGCGVDANGDGQ